MRRRGTEGFVTAAVLMLAALCIRCSDASDEEQASGSDGKGGPGSETEILFGDLHTHSANSMDAVVLQLPIVGMKGPRSPETSCEFARYCSMIDFWSINDHAEEQTEREWRENVEAIQHCDALYGEDGERPRLVSFLGWEWSYKSGVIDEDYGHRNIILKDLGDDEIPARPFAAPGGFADIGPDVIQLIALVLKLVDPIHAGMYEDVRQRALAFARKPLCDASTDTLDLPADCHEVVHDPIALSEKFNRWGLEALAIPHGTTWGPYHVPLANWQVMADKGMHDPTYGSLVEIDSGHGNAEDYRPWRHVEQDAEGDLVCPVPTPDFEPCCWRAGEIVRSRSPACAGDPYGEACEETVEAARLEYANAGFDAPWLYPDTTGEDWLDCGQCRDCFQPPALHRPLMSVQSALATGNFTDPGEPWAYKFGFTGSTDSHRAGPGSGYKEFREMSDGYGPARSGLLDLVVGYAGSRVTPDYERQNSFFYSGSLVAVHAYERSREGIWEALRSRRTYATSGERILLWFDLVNPPEGGRMPMGSETSIGEAPRFEARVVGSFRQAPGCPDWVQGEKAESFLQEVCFGECYHPTTDRHLITRLEVVKVTPQLTPEEPLEALIADPFWSHDCEPDPDGCTVTFTDPSFVEDGRPAAYYVRAYQEPTLQFNADTLRCTRDETGRCIESHPCRNGYRGVGDDCMAEAPEMAWSSPIFLKHAGLAKGG